jgi:integrase/recombinase XerD
MFDQFLKRPSDIARHENGPYAAERRRYLAFLNQEGRSRQSLGVIVSLLYSIAEWLPVSSGPLTPAQVCAAAEQWDRTRPSSITSNCRHNRRTWFIYHATSWLRFLGQLDERVTPQPYDDELHEFLAYLRTEKGQADATLVGTQRGLRLFLSWLSRQAKSLSAVSPKDITDYFSSEVAGRWSRVTVSNHVQYLRAFFRYAHRRRWSSAGIAESIDAPRLYAYEDYPRGPSWPDVHKLLESVTGSTPVQIRTRAALLLFAVYGFRCGEVCRLRLDDIDWEKERIHIRRPKQRKVQTYPLTAEVGNALLGYLEKVRPKSSHREVFLTLRQPYRPVSPGGCGTQVTKHEKKIGLTLNQYGPHALRHACATHLIAEGFTLKEVGDHLGHVSEAATRMYAKVDLVGLRQVADLDLCRVTEFIHLCEQSETLFASRGDLQALREVASLSLGGLL